ASAGRDSGYRYCGPKSPASTSPAQTLVECKQHATESQRISELYRELAAGAERSSAISVSVGRQYVERLDIIANWNSCFYCTRKLPCHSDCARSCTRGCSGYPSSADSERTRRDQSAARSSAQANSFVECGSDSADCRTKCDFHWQSATSA